MYLKSRPRKSLSVISTLVLVLFLMTACQSNKEFKKDEQIAVQNDEGNSDSNAMQGLNPKLKLMTNPSPVILTGLNEHRLVGIYKTIIDSSNKGIRKWSSYLHSGYADSETIAHFMPGLDILYGFNLINLSHYNLKTEKSNLLFNHPVLIKTLYYPSFLQDSLNKLPVNRNYFLISVYDEDSNKDSLLNRKDLRRFYYFSDSTTTKIDLLPKFYSIVKSQYDSKNDIMYLFANADLNKNGSIETIEPMHIFYIDLKSPKQSKRMY